LQRTHDRPTLHGGVLILGQQFIGDESPHAVANGLVAGDADNVAAAQLHDEVGVATRLVESVQPARRHFEKAAVYVLSMRH
jgi:hypothetical protein